MLTCADRIWHLSESRAPVVAGVVAVKGSKNYIAAPASQNSTPAYESLPPVSERHLRADRQPARRLQVQTENVMMQSDVLIIGAGPTGLVLALWLTKLGVEGPYRRQDGGARHDLTGLGGSGADARTLPAARPN